jgi:hypothetical protein
MLRIVIFSHLLRGMLCLFHGVELMAMGQVGVMAGCDVIPCFGHLRSMAVVLGCRGQMLGSGVVVVVNIVVLFHGMLQKDGFAARMWTTQAS